MRSAAGRGSWAARRGGEPPPSGQWEPCSCPPPTPGGVSAGPAPAPRLGSLSALGALPGSRTREAPADAVGSGPLGLPGLAPADPSAPDLLLAPAAAESRGTAGALPRSPGLEPALSEVLVRASPACGLGEAGPGLKVVGLPQAEATQCLRAGPAAPATCFGIDQKALALSFSMGNTLAQKLHRGRRSQQVLLWGSAGGDPNRACKPSQTNTYKHMQECHGSPAKLLSLSSIC
ncbi:skin secretory protein xP2-like [Lepus europaeus]|uniref:skin secretory protein xP2-like n=1 Tax=Lepus europaeus TaxID=9983 RepID=UPI002B47DAE7|nr:skin secretory protein xP2-like [Lepus europaeus]